MIIISTSISDEFLTGYWLISSEDAILRIYKANHEYKAKLHWYLPSDIKEKNLKYDKNNPVDSLRDRLIWDIDVIWGLNWNGENWDNGTLYDAQSGSKYSCYIEHIDNYNVKIRGYLFFSIIGKSEKLTRILEQQVDSIMKANPLPSYVLE